jgi:hypothetical protein
LEPERLPKRPSPPPPAPPTAGAELNRPEPPPPLKRDDGGGAASTVLDVKNGSLDITAVTSGGQSADVTEDRSSNTDVKRSGSDIRNIEAMIIRKKEDKKERNSTQLNKAHIYSYVNPESSIFS